MNRMIYRCIGVGYEDKYRDKVRVTSNLIKSTEESVNINITPLIYEVMDDDEYECNVLVYHDFISVYIKSDNSNYRFSDILIGFNTEKVMYHIDTPVLVLNKVIEFLEDADVKVGSMRIADFIATIGILY